MKHQDIKKHPLSDATLAGPSPGGRPSHVQRTPSQVAGASILITPNTPWRDDVGQVCNGKTLKA